MPEPLTDPLVPRWSQDCPAPAMLQTGDLLLPRLPTTAIKERLGTLGFTTFTHFLARKKWGHHPAGKRTLRELRDTPSLLLQPARGPTTPPGLHAELLGLPSTWGSRLDLLSSYALSLEDIDIALLMNVLEAEFTDLIDQWLDMPLDDFINSDLGVFLLETLLTGDASTHFFVGHVSLVIRERDGLSTTLEAGSELLVVEDNTTEYSHYRTAIHPYHLEIDPVPALTTEDPDGNRERGVQVAATARGWVNRRRALGHQVWALRPRLLSDRSPLNEGEKQDIRQRLAVEAKRLHGRPYGFFDHPHLGDDDRMYCAEFIKVVFDRVALTTGQSQLTVDALNTWDWMQDYQDPQYPSGDQKLFQLIRNIRTQQPALADPNRPFFVLTPAMIAESPDMQELFTPPGGDRYGKRP